ncbi:hypothetical protein OHB54_44930 [Streptomyces sp. NBC_01007]|nr:hypothetical protein OHB54_44930 [Streptomyces sp. NBC_01007]
MADEVTDATRLLSAGTYVDPGFRDAVVQELHVHQERVVAPSVGFDAVTVLWHALRARRLQTLWAAATTVLWVAGFLLGGVFFALFTVPAAVLLLASALAVPSPGKDRGRPGSPARRTGRIRRVLATAMNVVGGLLFAGYAAVALAEVAVDPGGNGVPAWFALAVPIAMAVCAAGYQAQVSRIIGEDLGPASFRPVGVSGLAGHPWIQVPGRDIEREQHSPLIVYHPDSPFLGFGAPHQPWVVAVELVRRRPGRPYVEDEFDDRMVMDQVRAQVEQLREPGRGRTGTKRNVLRRLAVDDCVFLPVTGLPHRTAAPYAWQDFPVHRDAALAESGTRRRHYLRVQLDSGGGESVLTVFVRAYAQRGVLTLECVPCVLPPVRSAFREVDRITSTRRGEAAVVKALRAMGQTPAFAARSVVGLIRRTAAAFREWAAGHGSAPADGPHVSVRELGSGESASLFQEIDVEGSLAAVRDRVLRGVAQALREQGYETDEFQDALGSLARGAVFLGGPMTGQAMATGAGSTATPLAAGPRSPGPTTNPDDDSWESD